MAGIAKKSAKLGAMQAEPASKEWFAKYGTRSLGPKKNMAMKMGKAVVKSGVKTATTYPEVKLKPTKDTLEHKSSKVIKKMAGKSKGGFSDKQKAFMKELDDHKADRRFW